MFELLPLVFSSTISIEEIDMTYVHLRNPGVGERFALINATNEDKLFFMRYNDKII